MDKYICTVCGYVYDEAAGSPETGIPAATKWADVPDDWTCPLCGASKLDFKKEDASAPAQAARENEPIEEIKELSALEASALCSNLARGCEKQYLADSAKLFGELADFFKGASPTADSPDIEKLLSAVEDDLDNNIPRAKDAAAAAGDRGAMRALVWNDKVTRILRTLLSRYIKEGGAMLENTGVFVCTICGFIYIGDTPPELCPVCKVPNWKFEKVTGR